MSARDELYNAMTVGAPLAREAFRLAEAFRAEVLNEAADEADSHAQLHGAGAAGRALRYLATTLRRMTPAAVPVADETAGDETGEVKRLRAELASYKDELDALHRHTLPQLRREIQHHQDGKKRWRDRAVKAEGERTRFKLAWQSARFRAQAYGEGILRITRDRESYQGWLKQEQEAHAGTAARLSRALSIYTHSGSKPYHKGWNEAAAWVRDIAKGGAS